MLLLSKPNGGKTTLMLNIIMRVGLGHHPFQRIIVVHCDPEATKEYSHLGVGAEIRGDIPPLDEIRPQEKTLLILEDLNYLNMSKEQQARLERLYGYVSTHKNVSCMLTAQDPFRILPTVRRCSNVFVLWNNHDADMVKTLARKTGISAKHLLSIFDRYCQSTHDCVWLDFTENSPAPLRKNGYQRIDILRAT